MTSNDTDQALHDNVQRLNTLEEVEIRMSARFDDPPVESFIGVITSINTSVMARKNSIRLEGKTDDLPDPYDQFQVDIWYDVDEETFDTRGVNGFFFNESNDRVTLPLGNLEGTTRRQWREREDVFSDKDKRVDSDCSDETYTEEEVADELGLEPKFLEDDEDG